MSLSERILEDFSNMPLEVRDLLYFFPAVIIGAFLVFFLWGSGLRLGRQGFRFIQPKFLKNFREKKGARDFTTTESVFLVKVRGYYLVGAVMMFLFLLEFFFPGLNLL
ncbi:hypothetical protein [Shimia sp. R9_3]|uniref:hypothetical protein n=1 Tax=Shimia sp. R9_3 TaxID=2821113 RepID=UPI001ADCCC5F|nr:hypothetical protein [Shimia sp. R9_3]MBO9402394.1 hypothetical protein [Shimia sp. R9_3]